MSEVRIFAMQRPTRGLTPVTFSDGLPRDQSRLEYACALPVEWHGATLAELAAAYRRLSRAGALPRNVVRG